MKNVISLSYRAQYVRASILHWDVSTKQDCNNNDNSQFPILVTQMPKKEWNDKKKKKLLFLSFLQTHLWMHGAPGTRYKSLVQQQQQHSRKSACFQQNWYGQFSDVVWFDVHYQSRQAINEVVAIATSMHACVYLFLYGSTKVAAAASTIHSRNIWWVKHVHRHFSTYI